MMALQSLLLVPTTYVLSQIQLTIPNDKLLPSVVHAPTLELKHLLDHLKYAYLGNTEILPVIIAKGLTSLKKKSCFGCLKNTILQLGGP